MADLTQEQMVTEINSWFQKIETRLSGLGATYTAGNLAASASLVIDVPTLLGYTPTTHHIYSLGVDIKIADPESTTTPKGVIPAYALMDWNITGDGKLTLINRHIAAVDYHLRLTSPVKK